MEGGGIDSNINSTNSSVDKTETAEESSPSLPPSALETVVETLGSHDHTNTNLTWADQSEDVDENRDTTEAVAATAVVAAEEEEVDTTTTTTKKHVNSDHLTKQLQKLALERQKVSD